MPQLLNLEHVSVFFDTEEGTVQAVRDISLSLQKGEILAIVGESGSGKSVLCKSVMKLLPKNSRMKGKILLQGNDILPFTDKEMCKLRGRDFAMLFQDPMAILNPTIPVGKQIIEAILQHKKISYKEVTHQAITLLDMVGIDDPVQRMRLQPHFFSGGMRQRCVLAIALALSPKILFADEPTTALDVTVQANILDLLKKIQKKTGIGIIIITHDLGVVARIADRVAVMYAGKIVETGTVEDIFYNSQHPYTWGLLGALPSLAVERGELKAIPGIAPSPINPPKGDAFAERNEYALAIDYKNMPPMFKVSESHSVASWLLDKRAPTITPPPYTRNLHKKTITLSEKNNSIKKEKQYKKTEILLSVRDYHQNFQINKKFLINAVNGISFDIHKNEFFGLVGESGCGKSTLAKAIMGMIKPTHGDIYFKNYTISGNRFYLKHKKEIQRNMQIIFQDSVASLNPYMKINDIIAEPLDIHSFYSSKQERYTLVTELLHKVGLDTRIRKKRPEELSGGQRQRVSIARSIALQPELIIADEPIASLDISIQAQIINLFQQLRKEKDFSLLFIAHDLSMVQYLCDRVGVMYKGKIVELAPTDILFKNPIHLYTRSLLSAIPKPDPIKERSKNILSSDSIELPQHNIMKEVEPDHFVLM